MSKNIIITILLFAVIYLFFNPKKEVEYKTITNTIIVNDSSFNQIIDTLIMVNLPSNIDTLKVINDYYSKFNYKRNFEDKYINIQLNDTIFQNQIFSGNLEYTIKNYSIKKTYNYGVGLSYINNIGVGVGMQYFRNNFNYSLFYYPSSNNISVGVAYCF